MTPEPNRINTLKLNITERMIYRRAVEAAIWSVPLVSFKRMRDSVAAAGAGPMVVGYFSEIQNSKFQFATPNDTTPYILVFWKMEDGPVVIEIPRSGDGLAIFGTIMDAWQRPLEDVGAAGKDRGLGGRYVLLPTGYDGEYPAGTFPIHQPTSNGWVAMRPIIPDTSPDSLKRAARFTEGVKVYPLTSNGGDRTTHHVDLYEKEIDGIIKWDDAMFNEMSDIINEEVVAERDHVMMGLLASLGIRKGADFQPDDATREILAAAAHEAHETVIHLYHDQLIPPFYEDRHWTALIPGGIVETGNTFFNPCYLDLDSRAAVFYAICTSVKGMSGAENPGVTPMAATFYLSVARDADGDRLDGARDYKLVVPADVPVNQFWSVHAHDIKTAAWLKGVSRVGLDSLSESLQANPDGSTDIYFGPEPPEGKDSNWIPTQRGIETFVMFRAYGPQMPLFARTWQLNDITKA